MTRLSASEGEGEGEGVVSDGWRMSYIDGAQKRVSSCTYISIK